MFDLEDVADVEAIVVEHENLIQAEREVAFRRAERDRMIRDVVAAKKISKNALAGRLGMTKQAIQHITAKAATE
jgi:hypothetical protein